MLRVNRLNSTYSNIGLITGSRDYSGNSDSTTFSRLATLSHRKQWILFTSHCPRPAQSEFSRYDINCNNIIHLKPSSLLTEEQIVLKAVQAGTASAVVASASLPHYARAKIQSIANENNCEVFFLAQPYSQHHSYHKWH